MRREKYIEKHKLEETVDKIERTVDSIIVEGASDKKAIKKLGFSGKIFLSAERKIDDLVEDVSRGSKRTAVLTDFDEHGKNRAEIISRKLDKEIDVVRSARQKFGSQLTENGRRAVEDVRPLFEDIDQKFIEAELDQLYFNP